MTRFPRPQAFISYVRSIHLQKDKSIFKLDDLPLEEYAASLGLAGAPKIKFTSKQEASAAKNKARQVEELRQEIEQKKGSGSEESDEEESAASGGGSESEGGDGSDASDVEVGESRAAPRAESSEADDKVRSRAVTSPSELS